jgi:hypothetical protein
MPRRRPCRWRTVATLLPRIEFDTPFFVPLSSASSSKFHGISYQVPLIPMVIKVNANRARFIPLEGILNEIDFFPLIVADVRNFDKSTRAAQRKNFDFGK